MGQPERGWGIETINEPDGNRTGVRGAIFCDNLEAVRVS
jgi:hypothetical protein